MHNLIDHQALAISRLATEFRESTNLINYIETLLIEANNIENNIQDVVDLRWIDTATGVNLDVLGFIVGQSRTLIDASTLFYFGFSPDPGASSFGTIQDPGIGGRFRGVDESTLGNRRLIDAEYRVFIRARIIKNSIIPTLENMVSFLKFLINVDQVNIIDGDMHYVVQLGKILSANEKAFLLNTDLVPKVAAVSIGYQEYDGENAFGFLGIPTSKGFGSVSNSALGGKFSSIIS